MEHDWDYETSFCKRCGAACLDVADATRPFCDEIGNMVGISHIIAQRRIQAAAETEKLEEVYP